MLFVNSVFLPIVALAADCEGGLSKPTPTESYFLTFMNAPREIIRQDSKQLMRLNPDVILQAGGMNARHLKPSREVEMPNTGRVDSAAWVPDADGSPLVVATSEGSCLLSINKASGEAIATFKNLQRNPDGCEWSPNISATSPDGQFLVTDGGPSQPYLINVHTRKKVKKLPITKGYVEKIFFSEDSQKIFVLSNEGEVYVWAKRKNTFALEQTKRLFRLDMVGPNPYYRSYGEKKRAINDSILVGEDLWIASKDGTVAKFSLSGQDRQVIAEVAYQLGGSVSKVQVDAKNQSLWALVDDTDEDETHGNLSLIAINLKTKNDILMNVRGISGSKAHRLFVLKNTIVVTTDHPESSVSVLSRDTGDLLAKYTMQRDGKRHYLSDHSGPNDPIHSATVNERTQRIAIGYDGGRVLVIDGRTGYLLGAFSTTEGDIRALTFSDNGKSLFVGAHMGYAGIFDERRIPKLEASARLPE